MQEKLMEQYAYLNEGLSRLPDDIHEMSLDLAEAKRLRAETGQALAALEIEVTQKAGGWAALGKNEGDRKTTLTALLNADKAYQTWTERGRTEERTVSGIEIAMSTAERQYGAVCYQARLLAALLNYLGNAGAPTPKLDEIGDHIFARPTPTPTNGAGYGTIDVAAARETGL